MIAAVVVKLGVEVRVKVFLDVSVEVVSSGSMFWEQYGILYGW